MNRGRALLATLALYPMLLAATWVLQFATSYNLDPISWRRSLVVVLLASLAVTILVRSVVRHTFLAGAIATFVVIAILKADSFEKVLVLACGVALLLVAAGFEDRGGLALPWARLHESLTLFCVAILLIQTTSYAVGVLSRPATSPKMGWTIPARSFDRLPNIYVIIADGHARADVLSESYGYEPSRFTAALEGLGFDVASHSRANYLNTQQSLPSFFNGAHLVDLGMLDDRQPDLAFLYAALRDNATAEFLRGLGYQVVGIPSGYDPLGERNGDRDLDSGNLNHLEVRMLQSTQLELWFPGTADDLWMAAIRVRTLAELHTLEDEAAANGERPKLVVAHLPTPHPPVVFDADCRPRERDELTDPPKIMGASFDPEARSRSGALLVQGEQTRCIDDLLARTLSSVVLADPQAVVILMSDHGPEVRLNWAAPANPGLDDRVSTLFAARTPGFDTLFPDDITLVNVIPRLLNRYFDAGIALQPDDVYVPVAGDSGALHRWSFDE